MKSIFDLVGGRHTFFGLFFSISGTWLACHNQLTGLYLALITAIQGLVFMHSVKEDIVSGAGVSIDVKGGDDVAPVKQQ